MNYLLTAFTAISSPALLIGTGYIARRFAIIKEADISRLNQFCYYVFLTALIFYNIYSANISTLSGCSIVLFCFVGVLFEFFVGSFIVHRIEPNPQTQSSMIQALYRTNLIIMGIPLAKSLYNEYSLMSVTFSAIVPLFNLLAVILLETHSGKKISFFQLLLHIVKTPLIIASIIAFFFKIFHIVLPNAIVSVLSDMSTTGSCTALVVLGAALNFKKIQGSTRNLLFCLVSRLVLEPLIMLVLAICIGFRGLPLLIVLAVFGCPIATTAYTMAKQLGGDADLASAAMILSVLFSCPTLFLWIVILETYSLL